MNREIPSTLASGLATKMQGIWWLLSREDRTGEGQKIIDPVLGADPIGILCYAPTHFSAQFMKRNRTSDQAAQIFSAGQNNTGAIGGYDAYFGTYEVDGQTGKVAHTLIGSINPSNIGITVLRDLQVDEDKLIIQLETTTPEGKSITRTLTWRRLN